MKKPRPKPRRLTNKPLQVSYRLRSFDGTHSTFFVSARPLLQELLREGPFHPDSHPNQAELVAQRELLKHAIKHNLSMDLWEDFWGQMGQIILWFFENGRATVAVDGKRLRFKSVRKKKWVFGSEPLMQIGGFEYRDHSGKLILKRRTWLS
jgi:hypothetical protein